MSAAHPNDTRVVLVDYLPGERVRIDQSEIIGYVNEVSVAKGRTVYRVAWMHCGSKREEYFDAFMLEAEAA